MKHLSLQRIAPSFFHASRVRIATELLSPPESELQQKDLWQDAGIQQRGRFPDSRLQQIIHLSRISNNKDRWAGNKNISSSRVRIASKGIFGQIQESSKGFVSQIQNRNRTVIPAESGLQQKLLIPPASGLQQKGSLARFRKPAKDQFPRFGIATHQVFLRSQDCNKILIPPELGLQQKDLWPYSGIQQRVRFPYSRVRQFNQSSGIRIATEILSHPGDCNILLYSFRVTIATEILIPPESGLQQKNIWQVPGIQQGVRFPYIFGDATNHLFLQNQDCDNNTYSSRVSIATKRNFGQIQGSSGGLVSQSRDCNK